MALPNSGQISMGDINVELGRSRTTANTSLAGGSTPTAGSLFSLANNTVNKTAPHAISEFYGYSTITYTLYLENIYDNDPCASERMTYSIYLGSDGKYYLNQGGTYVLASSITNTWYYSTGMYIKPGIHDKDIYTYDVYRAIDGGFELIGGIESDCP